MIIFRQPQLYVKFYLFFLCTLIWLGALTSLLLWCTKYIPDGEPLLFMNFEGKDFEAVENYPNFPVPWHFSEKGVLWGVSDGFAGSAGIKLTSLEKGESYMKWDIADPRRFYFLKFRGKMRTNNVVKGEKSSKTARFIVYFKDEEGNSRWNYPHLAGSLSGSTEWKEFIKIFQVPSFAVSAHVMLQNKSKSGVMWCDDIFLGPIRLYPQYLWYRNLLLGCAVIMAIASIITFKAWQNGGWLVLLTVAIIIFGVLGPKSYVGIFAKSLHLEVISIRKIDHLLLFLVLGVVSSSYFNRRLNILCNKIITIPHVVVLFVGLSLFAAVTEFMQLVIIGRTPAVSDWLTDIAGILLGILIAWFSLNGIKIGRF